MPNSWWRNSIDLWRKTYLFYSRLIFWGVFWYNTSIFATSNHSQSWINCLKHLRCGVSGLVVIAPMRTPTSPPPGRALTTGNKSHHSCFPGHHGTAARLVKRGVKRWDVGWQCYFKIVQKRHEKKVAPVSDWKRMAKKLASVDLNCMEPPQQTTAPSLGSIELLFCHLQFI